MFISKIQENEKVLKEFINEENISIISDLGSNNLFDKFVDKKHWIFVPGFLLSEISTNKEQCSETELEDSIITSKQGYSICNIPLLKLHSLNRFSNRVPIKNVKNIVDFEFSTSIKWKINKNKVHYIKEIVNSSNEDIVVVIGIEERNVFNNAIYVAERLFRFTNSNYSNFIINFIN